MKKSILLLSLLLAQSVFAVGHTANQAAKPESYHQEDCPLRKAKSLTLWNNTNPKSTVAKATVESVTTSTGKVK